MPSLREVGDGLLAQMPERIERVVSTRYRRARVRQDIAPVLELGRASAPDP